MLLLGGIANNIRDNSAMNQKMAQLRALWEFTQVWENSFKALVPVQYPMATAIGEMVLLLLR